MPLDSVVAADLLARILTDDAFRAEFRRDPVATCRRIGLDDVADELARESARAFQTLEVRESRSSLAGVLLAAAAEGVGVAQLVEHVGAGAGGGGGGLGAGPSPAANALSRAMQTIHDARAPQAGGAPGAPPQAAVGPPAEPLAIARPPEPQGVAAPPEPQGVAAPPEPQGVAAPPEAQGVASPPAPAASIPVDPRAVPALAPLAARYDIGVSSVSSEGGVSRVVISSVNGAPVSPTNVAARDLAHEMSNLDPASRPSRVGTPWRIASEGFVTHDGLSDRIEVELPEGVSAGRASAVFGAVAAPEGSAGRASAVFRAVANGADAPPKAAAPDAPAPAAPAAPPAPAAPASPAVAIADALPAPAAPGAPSAAPIDPSLMTNTNAGGKLHGSEFLVPDAEGAPGPNGNMHAGYDFFAKENAPIRSPIAGKVVEVRASRGTSGQIFGGTVKVQGADGKVWVFRHVTPGSVSVGQTVAAGTEIAKVSPWTDGPEHTHIEVWKTLGGGYNVSNMEDPLPYLNELYGNGAPRAAAPVAAVAAPAAPAAPAPAPGGGAAVAAAPVALDDRRIVAIPAVRDELSSRNLDPRAVPMLAGLAGRYQIGLTAVESHDGVSRLVIGSVNGRPVSPTNVDARDLAQELAALDPSSRPSDVGTPWRIRGAGFFTEPTLRNRIEVSFREDDLAARPAAVQAAPAPQAPVAQAQAAPVEPSAAPGAAAAADVVPLPADDAQLAAQLDAWMARKNAGAPLNGYGAVFVREGRANGVDPRLLVAIARAETSLGSDPGAIGIKNAFGWGVNRPFPTWEDNIATVAKGLRTGYINDGLDTIDEIQKRYCPVGAANDPTGLNVNWLRNVRLLYGELGGNPDGSVALTPSGAPDPSQIPAPVAAPVAAPVQPVIAAPAVPAAPVVPAAPPAEPAAPRSEGRASAVFGAVRDDGGTIARPNTARVLPAAPDPGRQPLQPAAQQPADQQPAATPAALADPLQAAAPGGTGANIVAIAKAELDRGVAESSTNDGPRIAEYRTATKGAGVGPWCAYFTSWVAAKAGVPVGADGSGIGYVPTLKNWAEQTDRYIPNGEGPPQIGDLVVFDWQKDGVLDHVGIVSAVKPDGSIETIEGNAGDKVAARSYGPDGYAGLVRLAPAGEGAPAPPAVAAPVQAAPVQAAVAPVAAAPAAPAQPVAAAAPPAEPAAPRSEGRASAVFGAVRADDGRIAHPNTARVLPAAPDPAQAQPGQQPLQPAAQRPVQPAATPGALADPLQAAAPAGRGASIVAIAKAELDRGVAETSTNDAPRIAEYRTATEGAGVGPWCAYFTSWVAAKAGVPVGPNGSGIGYVPTLKNWAEQTDRYIPNGEGPPQIGDLVVFDWQRDGVLDHVGIVSAVKPDGSIETIEGNAGDKVAARSYGPDGYAGLVRLAPAGEQAVAMPAVPAPAVVPPAAVPAAAVPAADAQPVVAATPAAPAAPPAEPPAPRSEGRASAVFGAVRDDEGRIARPNTARVLPAAPDPGRQPASQPAAPVDPAQQRAQVVPAVDQAAVAGAPIPYPGDGAPKEQVAAWMAGMARQAGLPPELPVMAALVESGLSNLDHGDADSLGFFQMRVSVWNQGDYAGYPDSPELQVKWFLDQASAIKQRRLGDGLSSFGTDPNGFGDWIADVERPAEQYRGRYQGRLDQARELLRAGGALR